MKYICLDCGNEIPEDSDFCYVCGKKKTSATVMNESVRFHPPMSSPTANKCASCGADLMQEDAFCPNCGVRASRPQMISLNFKLVKYGWIGILLAIIPGVIGFYPGLFPVFGLGHFYFKKWKRGVIFLLLSAMIAFAKLGYLQGSMLTDIIILVASVFIFLQQSMEVVVLAFMPPKPSE